MNSLWFCFAKLIQADLDQVKDHWNSHYIRKSHHDTVSGVPDVLFFLPEYSGVTDCLVPVTQAQIDNMEQHCQYPRDPDLDIYREYFGYVMQTKTYPTNTQDAADLFKYLTQLQQH